MPKKSTSCGIPSLRLRREAGLPLAEQICNAVRKAVEQGKLASGTELPSSRALARQLGVSRNTVVTAYEELAIAGVILGIRGSRTVVAGRGKMPKPKRLRELMKGSGYPMKARAIHAPDGTPIAVFSSAYR